MSEEIEVPEREARQPIRCRCRLGPFDECTKFTSGPDEPICDECMDVGHPDASIFNPRPVPGMRP